MLWDGPSDLTPVKFLNIMFYSVSLSLYAPPQRADAFFPENFIFFSNVALLMQLLPPRESPPPLYLLYPTHPRRSKEDYLLCKVFLFSNSPPSFRMFLTLLRSSFFMYLNNSDHVLFCVTVIWGFISSFPLECKHLPTRIGWSV